ncbi:MAG: DUF3445 domain-containing protein [Desulfurellaceae bacterium]|nr:DUF3445 domain-containing protein [Desulfurellaceae bacterium]
MTISPPDEHFPSPPDYAPFKAGPFRLSMGLMPLDLKDWIEPDTQCTVELKEKERLLTERHDEVFAALPEAAPSSAEALALLVEYLPSRFPELYKRSGNQLDNLATGQRWEIHTTPLHPLDLAGRLVQEDLCLMQRQAHTQVYHLVGASLCFPTRWRLADKIGQPLNTIHAPIPGYAEQLATTMDKFFDRLKVEKPVWRLNWSLMDDPTLFQPTRAGRKRADITPENAGDTLWLRIERQTLRRLPHTLDILFTIRVHVRPLAQLATQPDRAAQLAAALRTLPQPVRRYKNLPLFMEAALTWLDRAAENGERKTTPPSNGPTT